MRIPRKNHEQNKEVPECNEMNEITIEECNNCGYPFIQIESNAYSNLKTSNGNIVDNLYEK